MVSPSLPIVLLAPLLAAHAAVAAQNATVGGFQEVAVGANETALLTKALANDTLYGAEVTARVCFSAITSLRQQVVAGVNYKFDVTACDVATAALGEGKCPSGVLSSCAPRAYEITVFEQTWTDTIRVSAITPSSAGNSSGAGGNDTSVTTKEPSGAVPSPAPTSKNSAAQSVATATGLAVLAVALVGALL